MCVLESVCRFEVLTHIKNRFFFLLLVDTHVKESYFGIAFVYVRSSSFGCLKFFPHVVVTVSRTVESALSLVCFTLVLYHDTVESYIVKFDFVPLNSPIMLLNE